MNHLVINVAIFLQLGIFSNVTALSTHPDVKPIPHEPGIIVPVFRQIDKLSVSHTETLHPIEPVEVAPVTVPTPNTASSTANVAYSGTGDASLDWIVSHESGGNPYAMNPSGACGLFQSLPCSKVLNACGSLSNIACQIEWGRSYCISAYGSTYNAMLFWQSHRWY